MVGYEAMFPEHSCRLGICNNNKWILSWKKSAEDPTPRRTEIHPSKSTVAEISWLVQFEVLPTMWNYSFHLLFVAFVAVVLFAFLPEEVL
jgi:hypothetical protein